MPGSARGGAASALLFLACACDSGHSTIEKSSSEPLSSLAVSGATEQGVLDAVIQFSAGAVRVRPAHSGLAYEATLRHCGIHTEPSVEFVAPIASRRGRLTVSLKARRSGFYGFGGEENKAEIGLPAIGLASLQIDSGDGETVIFLAGIVVPHLAIRTGAGDSHVVFAADGTPADEVHITGSVGTVTVDRLFGVSPRATFLTGGVGGLDVDLSGRWRRDAYVSIHGSVGSVKLVLPRGVHLAATVGPMWREALEAAGLIPRGEQFVHDAATAEASTLTVDLEPGLGGLEIEWEDGE